MSKCCNNLPWTCDIQLVVDPSLGAQLEALAGAVRGRLARYCCRAASPEAAEDLVQETLAECWQNRHKIQDSVDERWVFAIARHVCLRWKREAAQRCAYERSLVDIGEAELEISLDRSELADLLDQAIEMLPPDARSLLLQRYLHERPLGEIAKRIGVSKTAAAVRLHRGRKQLQRVLAERCAFVQESNQIETDLWCMRCGERRLLATLQGGLLSLRCSACQGGKGQPFCDADLNLPINARAISGANGYSAMIDGLFSVWSDFYQEALHLNSAPCMRCGNQLRLQRLRHPDPLARSKYALKLSCACGCTYKAALSSISLCHPKIVELRQTVGSIRTLPEREFRLGPLHAVSTRFEAMSGGVGLEVIRCRDTYELLEIRPKPRSLVGI